MANITLAVERREDLGKGAARKLRRSGYIPGVVYGPGKDTVAVQTPTREFVRVYQEAGHTNLVDLDFSGETKTVLIKLVDRDPVRDDLVHVDFHEVRLDEVIASVVPVVITGEDARASDGGIVTQVLFELEVKSLPTNIPESIPVDVSGLTVGDAISVGDLTLPEGVETDVDPAEAVVSVVLPAAEPAEDEDEATEPELVGEEDGGDEE